MMTLRLGKHFLKSNPARLRRDYDSRGLLVIRQDYGNRGLLDYDYFEFSSIARLLDYDYLR